MDSLPIIIGVITGVTGAGMAAAGITSWLMKRLIVKQDEKLEKQDEKLDRIIEKLDDLRDKLHTDYVLKSEFETRFVTLKEDLQREIELVFRVLQTRSQARGPQDDGGA